MKLSDLVSRTSGLTAALSSCLAALQLRVQDYADWQLSASHLGYDLVGNQCENTTELVEWLSVQ